MLIVTHCNTTAFRAGRDYADGVEGGRKLCCVSRTGRCALKGVAPVGHKARAANLHHVDGVVTLPQSVKQDGAQLYLLQLWLLGKRSTAALSSVRVIVLLLLFFWFLLGCCFVIVSGFVQLKGSNVCRLLRQTSTIACRGAGTYSGCVPACPWFRSWLLGGLPTCFIGLAPSNKHCGPVHSGAGCVLACHLSWSWLRELRVDCMDVDSLMRSTRDVVVLTLLVVVCSVLLWMAETLKSMIPPWQSGQ
jgi:hypothetical protein